MLCEISLALSTCKISLQAINGIHTWGKPLSAVLQVRALIERECAMVARAELQQTEALCNFRLSDIKDSFFLKALGGHRMWLCDMAKLL